mmetsp:Transcript_48830/g.88279  ORF Transcript_48830/g.88279 Transcript_48830/m.88279 type:complete len:82 (-) Transcript_48830:244-489(-)
MEHALRSMSAEHTELTSDGNAKGEAPLTLAAVGDTTSQLSRVLLGQLAAALSTALSAIFRSTWRASARERRAPGFSELTHG